MIHKLKYLVFNLMFHTVVHFITSNAESVANHSHFLKNLAFTKTTSAERCKKYREK